MVGAQMTPAEYSFYIKSDVLRHYKDEYRLHYEGHAPRFEAQIDLFQKHLDGEEIRLVYDMGTPVPYSSYYFFLTKGAEIVSGMLGGACNVNEKVWGMDLNLCNPPDLTPADLVICTETLEHLPCNLFLVRRWLMSLVSPGKFMLLSFPLGGENATGYDRDHLGDYEKVHGHLREFTEETAQAFYLEMGWDVLDVVKTRQPAYQGEILNVLLRRPA